MAGAARRGLRRLTNGIDYSAEHCECDPPLLDSDVGAEGEGEGDDFCYRCRRFLEGAD